VLGVMGRNLLPELYNGVGSKGTDKVVLELPRILNEKVPYLGSILSGITCAGAFAAFMSTFSGLLVSMTGALAHDVYGRILRPNSTAQDRMRMFKWCAILIGGVAVLLGSCVEKLEINFMVGQAFAIAASSYFPLLFMSVWWRGMTLKGAAAGMLTGGVLAVVAISLTSFSTLAAGNDGMAKVFSVFKPLGAFWTAHPLVRILCEQPALWAVPLAIITMIVVSKLTSKDIPKDIHMKMLVLHAPEKLGLKQEYIQEHEGAGH
jgi:cation/acetate symporter